MMEAAPGDQESPAEVRTAGPFDTGLRLVYRLSLSDGTLIEEAAAEDPLCFDMGDGTLAGGLEDRLLGLEFGREYRFTLLPGDWCPLPDAANIHWLPRAIFSTAAEPHPGRVIEFSLPDGSIGPGRVLAVEAERVQVDFNHPLAGLTLLWTVRVLA
jgi:FKBP-type peptidyl-prolyl cis-trans isomerase SlpA